MIKKALFGMISASFLLFSCSSDEWSDERKEKIMGKCNEELYDCECYLELTMETFENPEDYNKKAEKDLEYQKQLTVKCGNQAEQSAGGDSWSDEDFAPLYENCNPEEYDCDCGVGKIIETYTGKKAFEAALSSNPNLLKETFEECRL